MSSGWEKSVKGATKIKLAAPKSKYIEHILIATHTGEAGVAEIFRALQNRLRDSAWTVVFKALIVVHFMIREGQEEITLRFLASNPTRKLAINNFTEVQVQGRNIRTYADYLTQRAVSFSSTKVDYVRSGEGRFKTLSVDKGLLRETESVQDQIKALCRCDFLSHEPENEITLTAFRLLTMDLLALFHVMNEGTINVLEHFFEMSKPDAERALRIYRSFVKQTEQVVRYLSIARHYDHATRLEIPKIKHAPTSLTGSLEEYLKDPDFEVNRRQFLAQQEAKKSGKATNGASKSQTGKASSSSTASAFPDVKAQPKSAQAKGPAPDLIDFFGSIEQNQQPMANTAFQQPQFNGQIPNQQTGFAALNPFLPQATGAPVQQQFPIQAQHTNPFLQMQQPQQQLQMQQPQQQLQMQPTAPGGQFSGFAPPGQQPRFTSTLSSIPQSSAASFQPQPQQFMPGTSDASGQSTNPFRQSLLPSTPTGSTMSSFATPSTTTPLSSQPTGTNPFAKPGGVSQPNPQQFGGPSPFSSQPPNSTFASANQAPNFQQQAPLAPNPTGSTNPFAKPAPITQSPFAQAPLTTQATGSTNPFRQSAFVNQNTGMGWQNTPQGTIGGVPSSQVETVPVFPRPGMG